MTCSEIVVEGVYRIMVLMISKRHSDATKDGDVCMLMRRINVDGQDNHPWTGDQRPDLLVKVAIPTCKSGAGVDTDGIAKQRGLLTHVRSIEDTGRVVDSYLLWASRTRQG